jgi:hypothetical protein
MWRIYEYAPQKCVLCHISICTTECISVAHISICSIVSLNSITHIFFYAPHKYFCGAQYIIESISIYKNFRSSVYISIFYMYMPSFTKN